MSELIHETAIIEKGALIGSKVKIGPYSIIGKHVVIKDNVEIGPYVSIQNHTEIGEGSKIYQGSAVGGITQAVNYKGDESYLTIGRNNVIREFCTINATEGKGNNTIIGDDNLFMAYVHVAHHCIIGNNIIMANGVTLAGHVIVEDRAFLGGLSGVHQFVKIGEVAMIGGHSKIVKDVPPFCTVDGDPVKIYGINKLGLERAGFSKDEITELKQIYKILFYSGINTSQAVTAIKRDFSESKLAARMVAFIESSERGIIKKH